MQSRYWGLMCDLREEYYFYEILKSRSFNWNKIISLTISIFTASSVASWQIWQVYTDVWAWIVAITQVLAIVNAALPFNNRVECLKKAEPAFLKVCSLIESYWYDVKLGRLSGDNINDFVSQIEEEWAVIKQTYLNEDCNAENSVISDLAYEKMMEHMQKYQQEG